MPAFDWQFIVVTIIAAGAVWMILRRFVPARRTSASGMPAKPVACEHCASNEANATKRPTRSSEPRESRVPTVPVVALRDLRATARSTGRAARKVQ